VPEHQQEALFAWVRSGSYIAEDGGVIVFRNL